MIRHLGLALALATAQLVLADRANADETAEVASPPPPARVDEMRFRGGATLGFGPVLLPDRSNPGGAALEGHVGVQINDYFAIYAAPSVGLYFVSGGSGPPSHGGISQGMGALVELTLFDRFSIAAGPEGVFVVAPVGNDVEEGEPEPPKEGAEAFGGRLRLTGYPNVRSIKNRVRGAVAVGVDVRVMRGDAFTLRGDDLLFVVPALFVGYEWM